MKKQEMNRDEVGYASLIVDSITLKLEIRAIKVYIKTLISLDVD
jgi:hypothetical protein